MQGVEAVAGEESDDENGEEHSALEPHLGREARHQTLVVPMKWFRVGGEERTDRPHQ